MTMSFAGKADCSQQTQTNQPPANNLDIRGLDIIDNLLILHDFTLEMSNFGVSSPLQGAVHRNGVDNIPKTAAFRPEPNPQPSL